MDKFNADLDDYRSKTVQSMITLAGKVIAVTGACRGLGLAIAVGCAELGATVAILDVLDAPTETLAQLEAENNIKLHYFHTDVSSYQSLTDTFNSIEAKLGAADGLVNNAGIGTGGPFLECSKETIDRILAINMSGTIYAAQIAAQQMQKHSKGGSIINISSIGGHAAIPKQLNAIYCASKGAVLGFTRSLAVEFAPKNIRVNSISPGFFLTRCTPGYIEKDVARLESYLDPIPMKRFADRAELKSMVAFLMTPAASYITGEDIAVDGGVLAA